ncbi:MAG: LamG-like jellyroll fold domain-containing protein, partial [Lewinella sp.]
MENQEGLSQKVRELIRENRTKEALELLSQAQLPELANDIALLDGQHTHITDEINLGVVDSEEARLEIRRINLAIIRILDKTRQEGFQNAERSTSLPESLDNGGNSTNRIIALVAGIAVVSLLAFFWFNMAGQNGPDNIDSEEKVDSIKVDSDSVIESLNILELASLVAYYPFDDDENDLKGNFDKDTAINTRYISDRYKRVRSAVHLKGDSYIEFPKVLEPENNKLSISMWVKAKQLSGVLWGQSTDSKGQYIGQNHTVSLINGAVNYDNYPPLDNERTKLTDEEFVKTNIIYLENWSHIVVTRDDLKIILYINGEEVASNDNKESFNNKVRGPVSFSCLGARKNGDRN